MKIDLKLVFFICLLLFVGGFCDTAQENMLSMQKDVKDGQKLRSFIQPKCRPGYIRIKNKCIKVVHYDYYEDY